MNPRNEERKKEIYKFIESYIKEWGVTPSTQQVADGTNCSKPTAYKFIVRLIDEGMLERIGTQILPTNKSFSFDSIPVVGTIACGKPILAIEDIQGYLPINVDFLGDGNYFALIAEGDSMIECGINSGDIVIIREQSTAENGQIVVAIIEDELSGEVTATLKKFYKDEERHRYRLHPENIMMNDIIVDRLDIRGIAVKVIKDLI